MTQPATLVVTATPNPAEMEAVQGYLAGVMPLLIQAGGTLVKRQKVGKVLNGAPSGMVMVMDFASANAIEDLFASDDYAALVPTRDKGFSDMNILITGDM